MVHPPSIILWLLGTLHEFWLLRWLKVPLVPITFPINAFLIFVLYFNVLQIHLRNYFVILESGYSFVMYDLRDIFILAICLLRHMLVLILYFQSLKELRIKMPLLNLRWKFFAAQFNRCFAAANSVHWSYVDIAILSTAELGLPPREMSSFPGIFELLFLWKWVDWVLLVVVVRLRWLESFVVVNTLYGFSCV